MRINYNISSIIAKNALNNNDSRLSISTQKLSSGYKILSAKDDAAGLAIARKMNMQIRALERANQNSNDGLSVVDTADGAMTEMHSILQRMNELSIQAANGTNSDDDRSQIQLEIDQLVDEIDRIADTTQFNAQNLLDGSFAYKGYTNNENVKVMSYSEEVSKGTYVIDSLTYYIYGDETIEYTDGTETDKKTEVDYKVDNSSNAVKNALEMDDDTDNDIKGFPAGSKVTVDDEYINITDETGFELKLYVNDRDNVAASGVQTSSVAMDSLVVTTYKGVSVTDENGNEYTISTLIDNSDDGVYSDARTQTYSSLEDDLGIENISKVEIIGDEITVSYIDNDKNPQTIKLTVTDGDGNPKALADSKYSTSTRTKTKYTVGTAGNDDDSLKIEITKMGPMIVQTGANEGQQLEIEIPQLNSRNLGINGLSVSTEDDATDSIDIVGNAINQLSSVRAKIGAYANRLEHTVTNLDTTVENMTESYSRVMDVDMAEEMTEYTNMQVLVQAATSVLSQANEMPQQVLQLLQ